MNKEEIDKIINRLERIDHKEYSCGVVFANSSIFYEVGRCFDERKKIANYINDLQQENKQLKEIIDKIKELVNNFIKDTYIKCDNQLNLTEILKIIGDSNE